MEYMDQIREILDQILEGQEYESCGDFMEAGLLDSMDMMDLVEQLEQVFDIEVSGRDIVPENFKNVNAIETLVKKYMGETE